MKNKSLWTFTFTPLKRLDARDYLADDQLDCISMQWTTLLFSVLSATGKFNEVELTELIEQEKEKKENKVNGAGDQT